MQVTSLSYCILYYYIIHKVSADVTDFPFQQICVIHELVVKGSTFCLLDQS